MFDLEEISDRRPDLLCNISVAVVARGKVVTARGEAMIEILN